MLRVSSIGCSIDETHEVVCQMCGRFLFSLALCLKLFSHDVPLHPTHPRILSLTAWVNWGKSRGRHVKESSKEWPKGPRLSRRHRRFCGVHMYEKIPL